MNPNYPEYEFTPSCCRLKKTRWLMSGDCKLWHGLEVPGSLHILGKKFSVDGHHIMHVNWWGCPILTLSDPKFRKMFGNEICSKIDRSQWWEHCLSTDEGETILDFQSTLIFWLLQVALMLTYDPVSAPKMSKKRIMSQNQICRFCRFC